MSQGVYTVLSSDVGKIDKFLIDKDILYSRILELKRKYENTTQPDGTKIRYWQKALALLTYTHRLETEPTKYVPHIPIASTYIKKPKLGGIGTHMTPDNNMEIRFDLQGNNGQWLNDMVVHVTFDAIGDPNNLNIKYRYCDFPGIRLFKTTRIKVGDVTIDEYTADDVLFDDFKIGKDTSDAYSRMLGQQSKLTGEYYFKDQQILQKFEFYNGPQTYKSYQPKLELWIPLRFFFNKHIETSFNNIRVSEKQKIVSITLESLNNIIQAVDENNNIIPNYIKTHNILNLELYTKNIYVDNIVSDLFANNPQYIVTRVSKRQEMILNKSTDDITLSSLAFPVETLYFGFRPVSNHSDFNNWYKFTSPSIISVPIPAILQPVPPQIHQQVVARTIHIKQYEQVVDKIGFFIHGNTLQDMESPDFYRDVALQNDRNLVTPYDTGKYIYSFKTTPSAKKTGGYINSSRARELILRYESSYISMSTPVVFYLTAQCINVLIYDGTTVNFRYMA